MSRWILVAVLVAGIWLQSCFNQNFLQVPESVDGVYQQNLHFHIKLNLTGTDRSIQDVGAYIADGSPQGQQFVGGGSDFGPKTTGSQFDGRVTTTRDAASNTYSFTISNIQYEDDVELKIVILYSSAGLNFQVAQAASRINVTGGPTLCGAQLQNSYEMDIDNPSPISLVFCGNKQPTLMFTFSSFKDEIVTNVTAVSAFKHRYHYVIQLRDLIPSDCNSILTYRATGESTALTGQTKIDLRFTPNITNITAIREGLCLRTTWNGPDTGDCSPVSYQLEYYWIDGNITNITIPAVVNQHSYEYCADYLHHVQDIYHVTIHGTFKDITTTKHRTNVTHIIPTTTTTMTTTVVQNNATTDNSTSIGDDSSDTDVVLIAALAGGIGFLVILIVILLICCVWCKKSKSFAVYRDKTKQLQMHSIHEYDSNHKSPKKKTNPMYSIDTEHPAIELGHDNGTVHIERLNYAEPEKIGDAQLKYYSPEEFDITPPNTGYTFNPDKHSPPVSPAAPPPSHIMNNMAYQGDEEENVPELV